MKMFDFDQDKKLLYFWTEVVVNYCWINKTHALEIHTRITNTVGLDFLLRAVYTVIAFFQSNLRMHTHIHDHMESF